MKLSESMRLYQALPRTKAEWGKPGARAFRFRFDLARSRDAGTGFPAGWIFEARMVGEAYTLAAMWLDPITPQPVADKWRGGFTKMVQDAAMEVAGWGVILAPENHVVEFWTSEHVARLANALRRPRKRPSLKLVTRYLRYTWESKKLDQMDRLELAQHVNGAFGTSFKPGTLWQLAYRNVDQSSKRTSGPKERAEQVPA